MENAKPTYGELQQKIKILEEQFDFHRILIDSTVDWEMMMSPNGDFTYVSPSCKTISGYSASEFTENSDLFIQIVHPLDKESVNKHFYKKMHEIEADENISFRIITKDGTIKWVEHFCKKVYDNSGNPIGYRSSNRDITKRKEIEIEIETTNKTLFEEHQLFTQGNVVIFKWKNEGNWPVEFVSQNVEEILGYTPEEIKSPQFLYSKLIHPDDIERVAEEVGLYGNQGAEKFEHKPYRLICKNGKTIWVSDNTIILRNDSGEITNYIGYLVDITTQKVAEEALRESENRLSITLNSIGDGVIATDESGMVTGMNPVAEQFCGWAIAEAKGKPLSEVFKIINAETRELVSNPAEKVMESGFTIGLANHTVLISKAGNEYQIADSAAPIKDKEGKTIGVILVFSDVTEKYAIQQSLIGSEKKFRLLVENAQDEVFTVTPDGKLIYISPNAMEFGGYVAEDEIGEHISKYIADPAQLQSILADLAEVIQKQQPATVEFLYLAKNREPFWVEVSANPIIENNKVVGINCIMRNISERKHAEELLRKSEEKYYELYTLMRLMSDTMPDLLWAKDLNERFIFTNKAICDILLNATDTSEPIGKTDMFFALRERESHPEDPSYFTFGESCVDSDKVTLQEMKEMQFDEYGNIKGKLLYFDVHKAPLFNNEGKLIGVVGSGRDNTEKKKVLEELILAKKHAEESDRLKSAFLANMSHEIRTPMNGILGFANLLKEANLSGEAQQEYIQIIEKSGARMLNIINDIVDISKIESGLMKLVLKESNINEQIEYIFTFFKPEVEAKGMKLLVKTSLPSKEAIIKTDREKVFAILTNLVKNAIKYSIEGVIELGYIKNGETLEFYVKDTGIGIPKDKQEAIFERFIQADIEDKMARQGAGLGLSISKAYVDMLGGKIWVESEEGIGSTFYFTIPVNTEPEEKTVVENIVPADVEKNQMDKLKILIAEDDETSEKLITINVDKFSKGILKVRNGFEAVEVCRNNPDIDLILMDIQMPEMNGYEATRQIRQFNKNVVIIAQTAFGLSGDRENAIKAGCNDYIAKPINKAELLTLIQKYFRG